MLGIRCFIGVIIVIVLHLKLLCFSAYSTAAFIVIVLHLKLLCFSAYSTAAFATLHVISLCILRQLENHKVILFLI